MSLGEQIARCRPLEHVYIVRMVDTTYCKIGWTKNFPQRMRSLQRLTPHPLHLLAHFVTPRDKGRVLEQQLQRQWQSWKFLSEWFDVPVGIIPVIEDLSGNAAAGRSGSLGFLQTWMPICGPMGLGR